MKTLNENYKDRIKACKKLEKATSKLLRSVTKAKYSHDKAENKQHMKEEKAERKEYKQEEKALAKRRKLGEKEALRAQQEYERAHGMTPSRHIGEHSDNTNTNNPPHLSLHLSHAESSINHLSVYNYPDASTIGQSTDYERPSNLSSRPLRQRTITSELEAGRLPPSPTFSPTQVGSPTPPPSTGREGEGERSEVETILETYAPPNKRPRHRLGFLGLFGRKVDTIEWCKVSA